MKQIGILGGSFNPIHQGHLIVAQGIFDEFHLDKILLLPNKYNPFKSSNEDNHQCIEMLNLIKENNSIFDIDLRETIGNEKNYTYNTIKSLISENPDNKYYFIIGSDIIEKLKNWYKIDQLLQMIPFIVVERPGYPISFEILNDLKRKYNANFLIYNGSNVDISSTTIRNKRFLNKSIKYLTPDEIINFIEDNNLYLKKEDQIKQFKKQLKKELKPKRFEHSINVMNTAVELAERFDIDIQKAEIAGLLHDCAKSLSFEEMVQLADKYNFKIPSEFYENPSTLHAIIGQLLAQLNYGIKDPEILSSIAKHTTGDVQMSKLDKIIFLADYIEPLRSQPGVEEVRELAKQDLNKAVFKAMDNNLNYLRKNNYPINKTTEKAWKFLKDNE